MVSGFYNRPDPFRTLLAPNLKNREPFAGLNSVASPTRPGWTVNLSPGRLLGAEQMD